MLRDSPPDCLYPYDIAFRQKVARRKSHFGGTEVLQQTLRQSLVESGCCLNAYEYGRGYGLLVSSLNDGVAMQIMDYEFDVCFGGSKALTFVVMAASYGDAVNRIAATLAEAGAGVRREDDASGIEKPILLRARRDK